MEPHRFSALAPDPDLHEVKSWIRIRIETFELLLSMLLLPLNAVVPLSVACLLQLLFPLLIHSLQVPSRKLVLPPSTSTHYIPTFLWVPSAHPSVSMTLSGLKEHFTGIYASAHKLHTRRDRG